MLIAVIAATHARVMFVDCMVTLTYTIVHQVIKKNPPSGNPFPSFASSTLHLSLCSLQYTTSQSCNITTPQHVLAAPVLPSTRQASIFINTKHQHSHRHFIPGLDCQVDTRVSAFRSQMQVLCCERVSLLGLYSCRVDVGHVDGRLASCIVIIPLRFFLFYSFSVSSLSFRAFNLVYTWLH